jgi:hypothetical protein
MPQRVLEGFWEVRVFEVFLAKATPTMAPLSPKTATLDSSLKFGKKIYKTKPTLPNNPSHPLALPRECKFSQ